jgi:polysaccharide deacetylase family protein (PEP-CTERM system associated)
VLSFDVEEHFRIEAAAGLALDPALRDRSAARLGPATHWVLNLLELRNLKATFFVVGLLARSEPGLIRDIHSAGHEVASHGWDHRRVLAMSPEEFRADLRASKDALEQLTGAAVVGYRAPTFSVVRRTAWAVDLLVEAGFLYDSSVFPVRHDRYGVPDAPRWPFRCLGHEGEILELPPATWRLAGVNLPVGGGGYFRLLPPAALRRGLRQLGRHRTTPVATLYFHPWEFDPGQPRLPLRHLSRFRTYVGLERARRRLEALVSGHRFARAVDVATALDGRRQALENFWLGGQPVPAGSRQG